MAEQTHEELQDRKIFLLGQAIQILAERVENIEKALKAIAEPVR